jgi:hypothetical protein
LNHELRIELPSDPEFKYSREFLKHLERGYPKQNKIWTDLKRDWGNFLDEAKDRFQSIREQFVEKVEKETKLHDYNSRGAPPDTYFNTNHMVYLIYEDLYSKTKYGREFSNYQFNITPDKNHKGIYYVDKGSFSHLIQGSKGECKKVIATFNDFVKDSRLMDWMKNHIQKREKLDKNLQCLIDFLEDLSKLIENGKILHGQCGICRK